MLVETAATAGLLDYDTFTLEMERRIALHVRMAHKPRSSRERQERVFFAAAANEALFIWMLFAGKMGSDGYAVDKARLIEMVERIGRPCDPI